MFSYALDHIGIAVKDIEKAKKFYEKSYGLEFYLRETIDSQGVEVIFLKLSNSCIELLCPLGPQSKLNAFLEKRGEGFHHLCYRVSDIRHELARLKNLGFKLVDETPRRGAHGSEIAFIHPSSTGGVLTELCQY